ncbi:MAG: alpha-hydroxy-acid oxidizing protein, partial [Saprospiraceae bacterium]
VQEASMLLTWREHTLPAPFMLAPIGVLELAHREGDLAVAKAAKATHIPMIISSQASFPMEEIASQLDSNPRLFQLYYSKSKELSQSFIRRAEAIGCTALVVTLDTTMLGWRVRDLDLGYSPFILGKGIAQYYSDPVFNQLPDPVDVNSIKPPLTLSLIKSLITLNSRMPGGFISNIQSKRAMKSVKKFLSVFNNPGMNWDDIALIRSWTKMPIYLKGIIRPDDALKAVDAGVDGIIISNHGGRQIDGSVSTVEALPSIVNAVNDKLEIWIDSGIRTGSDVFKCVALGAKGVLIGRPYAYALACGGQQGVVDCLSNIMAELELIMTLSGCRTLADINVDLISHP